MLDGLNCINYLGCISIYYKLTLDSSNCVNNLGCICTNCKLAIDGLNCINYLGCISIYCKLMLDNFNCSDYLNCICIYKNFARCSCLGLYALDGLCIFVENDYIARLNSLCRDDLRICRKLADLVSLHFVCGLRRNNLLALLVGCYCVLKLGSALDLLCLCRINSKSITTLVDFLCRLSLESLCRVGLFCNCVCARLRCYSNFIKHRYYLFTGVENLIYLFFCRNRCDILLYYNAIFINRLCNRSRSSGFLSDDVSALGLICLESSTLYSPCGRGIFYNLTLCLKRIYRGRLFYGSRFRSDLGSLFGLDDLRCVFIKVYRHNLNFTWLYSRSNFSYGLGYRSGRSHIICLACNLNSRVSMLDNYIRLVCALSGDLLGFLDIFG